LQKLQNEGLNLTYDNLPMARNLTRKHMRQGVARGFHKTVLRCWLAISYQYFTRAYSIYLLARGTDIM